MRSHFFIFIFLFFNHVYFFGLKDIPADYIIFEEADSGYDLYIKKTYDVESILLTDSQKDPEYKSTNYGLRTTRFHPCNGNEKRILDNKVLYTKYDAFFLVDSTVENHSRLGEAFHFFLPEVVIYGYSWTRNGSINVGDGIEINLRLFEKKFSDYSGDFKDQWVKLILTESEDNFRPNVIDEFASLAAFTDSKSFVRKKTDQLDYIFGTFIPENVPPGNDADLIFVIDATNSMREEIPYFKKIYPDLKAKILSKVNNLRVGFVFYRDYGEQFVTRTYDLTDDLAYADKLVKSITIDGGDDVPEAMYEGLVELGNLTYRSSNRIAYLFGDAPPHTNPRGKVAKRDALKVIRENKIKLFTICFPYK